LTKPFLNEIFCIHAQNIRARRLKVQLSFVYKRQGKPRGVVMGLLDAGGVLRYNPLHSEGNPVAPRHEEPRIPFY